MGSENGAMTQLGIGLSAADHHEDALSVERGRVGYAAAPWRIRRTAYSLSQGNLANTYDALGRHEEALSMRHEITLDV